MQELPAELKKGLEIVYVENFIEVLPHALLGLGPEDGEDDDVTEVTHGGALRARTRWRSG